MRLALAAAAAITFVAWQAQAQTQTPATPSSPAPAAAAPAPMAAPPTAPAATAPATAPRARTHISMQQRFDEANTSHDGKLTLDQAKAGLPMVARHFDAIDKDKKGYVTVDDIKAYAAKRRAAHAAHHAASPS